MAYPEVHAIDEARQAVCGLFENTVPEEWPDGYYYDIHPDFVNCERCLEILEAHARQARIFLREETMLDPPGGDPCW